MSNINEIAKLAGVSRATVSRVINSKGYVKEETRQKVQKVVDDLDYTPNQNAIYLKNGETKTIGLVSPDFSDILSHFLSSFATIAKKYGYQVTLLLTDYHQESEIEAFQKLKQKQIDGIFQIVRSNEWEVIEKYSKYGPIVTWQRVTSPKIESVFMDHYEGFKLGLDHLYAKGHREIVPFFGIEKSLNTVARYKAWQDFCQEKGVALQAEKSRYNLHTSTEGRELARWWEAEKEKPTALLFPTDNVAVGFLAEARERGISVPKDVAVVGFDNSSIAELFNLTTIDYPMHLQAENAFFKLYNQLKHKNLPLHPLSFKLITRGTT
ncbi:LacI family DNA-binding transcriptional regulator [Carnobacterium maltaromaticum]|uniref:LacI family DNA-binding transcriptional regulator n=1 Tax=Carnobacterium maltaromaticum TaxID=2751 RepID=UPI0039BE8C3B